MHTERNYDNRIPRCRQDTPHYKKVTLNFLGEHDLALSCTLVVCLQAAGWDGVKGWRAGSGGRGGVEQGVGGIQVPTAGWGLSRAARRPLPGV